MDACTGCNVLSGLPFNRNHRYWNWEVSLNFVSMDCIKTVCEQPSLFIPLTLSQRILPEQAWKHQRWCHAPRSEVIGWRRKWWAASSSISSQAPSVCAFLHHSLKLFLHTQTFAIIPGNLRAFNISLYCTGFRGFAGQQKVFPVISRPRPRTSSRAWKIGTS